MLFRVSRQRQGLTQVALGMAELDDVLVPIPITDPRTSGRGRGVTLDVESDVESGGDTAPWALGDSDAPWGTTALDDWTNGSANVRGVLQLLLAGALPPDVGEFVGSRSLSTIIEQLRERADIVLIDSPPLLRVGDAITLSGKVDGMLIAANIGRVRRPVLTELRRVLDSCPVDKLGFVLTGSNLEEGYGYGYGQYYAPATKRGERETVA